MQIVSSKRFDRSLSKLYDSNPVYKGKVSKVLKSLITPKASLYSRSLRLHKLRGADIYSVSVDISIRIIFQINGNEIVLLNIGKHEDVY